MSSSPDVGIGHDVGIGAGVGVHAGDAQVSAARPEKISLVALDRFIV